MSGCVSHWQCFERVETTWLLCCEGQHCWLVSTMCSSWCLAAVQTEPLWQLYISLKISVKQFPMSLIPFYVAQPLKYTLISPEQYSGLLVLIQSVKPT